jgi:hypothetical protein
MTPPKREVVPFQVRSLKPLPPASRAGFCLGRWSGGNLCCVCFKYSASVPRQ